METFDGKSRRKGIGRGLSGSPKDTLDRRMSGDRREGIDRRSGTDRRSPSGFRALTGMGRRKMSCYPPLFDFQAPSDSALRILHSFDKENGV